MKRNREGLGDWAEKKLAKIGITEERYVEIKERFKLPPRCNCKKRKKWLNQVSDWWRGESPPEQPGDGVANGNAQNTDSHNGQHG